MRLDTPAALELDGRGLRFAIVASRFNHSVVQALVDGAKDALRDCHVQDSDVQVYWVAGALELPLVAQTLAQRKAADAIVCLGCVIQGGTDHYEHVCRAAVDGIQRAAQDTGVPIGNGVLTVGNAQQALDRAAPAGFDPLSGKSNKGAEAALAALETTLVLRSLP
jgi:6,7-dimethyl-8-ribityllumazine synthase